MIVFPFFFHSFSFSFLMKNWTNSFRFICPGWFMTLLKKSRLIPYFDEIRDETTGCSGLWVGFYDLSWLTDWLTSTQSSLPLSGNQLYCRPFNVTHQFYGNFRTKRGNTRKLPYKLLWCRKKRWVITISTAASQQRQLQSPPVPSRPLRTRRK